MWIELLLIVGLAAWVGHAVWRACVRGAGGEAAVAAETAEAGAAEAGAAEAPPAVSPSAPRPAPPPSGPSSGPPPG